MHKACYKLHSKTPIKKPVLSQHLTKRFCPFFKKKNNNSHFKHEAGLRGISMPHRHVGDKYTPEKYLRCTHASSLVTPLEPPSYLIVPRLRGITHSVSSSSEVV